MAVADVLRWKTPKTPSHIGGSCSGEALYDNLTVLGTLQPGVRYVLVDDVFTGGGHLQASKRRLEEGSPAAGEGQGRWLSRRAARHALDGAGVP